LSLLLLTAPLTAQGFASRADSIVTTYVGTESPGCTVAIDTGATAFYRGAFGLAELEHGVPIAIGTIFEAGSVSKQFTAASVLLLEARGLLSLDDTLQQWFPEIPVYAAPITLRHLMLHTSGLRDWGSVMGLAGWGRWTATYTQDDALAIIARQRGLNHPTGTEFSYTNSGYNLLAMLVERVTHRRFDDFMRTEFFEPLGMEHTSWRSDYTTLVPGRAQAYDRSAGRWVLSMPFEDVIGNGGLLTTVEDMLIWTRALHEGRLGRPDVSRQMMTDGTFNDGRPVGYGGGLFLTPIRGVPSINHGGATAGYRAVLSTFPDQRVMVAMLCNRADANPPRLATELLDPLLPFEATAPTSRPEPAAAPYRLDPARYTEYVGRYFSDEVPATMELAIAGGQLTVSRKPGDRGTLRATGPDVFAGPGSTFHFERDPSGRIVAMRVTVSRAVDMRFERLE
jgi:CubicO group peptidase (beta-lactamase class C family)